MEFMKDENAEINAYIKGKKFDDKEKERIAICRRAEFLNVTRAHHVRRLEDEFYRDNVQNTQAGTANAQMRKEQDERLSKDIVELNRKETRDKKYRQHLLESSAYLRKVQNKLREAYNKKEVAAQIAEVENNRQKEKNKQYYIYLQSRKAMYSNQEKEYLDAQAAIDRKAQYRQELQNQMFSQAQEKQRQYEEKLRERKEVECIVKRMNDEDVKERQIKKELQRKTQEEINKYLAAQEMWKAEKRKKILEDNEKIETLIKEDQRKLFDRTVKITEKQRKREEWLQRVAQDRTINDAKTKDYKGVLEDYTMLCNLEKRDEDDRKNLEKAIATRLDEQATLEKQCKEKEERDKQYYIEDKRWGEVSKQVDAEYNNKMKKKADDQRKYFIDLRETHKKTAALHKLQRVEEFNLIESTAKEMKENEAHRWQSIRNERMKLLKQHIPNVYGFISAQLIDKNDLPELGEEITKKIYERK